MVDEVSVRRNRRMHRSGKGWSARSFEGAGKGFGHTNATPVTAAATKMATQVVGGMCLSKFSILSSDQLLLSMMKCVYMAVAEYNCGEGLLLQPMKVECLAIESCE